MEARIPGLRMPRLTIQRNPGNLYSSLPKALCHKPALMFLYHCNRIILGYWEDTSLAGDKLGKTGLLKPEA